jgi:hypothetical protein
LKVNGLQIKVSPVSPIAQAQNMGDIEKITQWVQIASALGPEGQLTVNTSAISDYIADKLGVPAELRTSMEERAQAVQAAAQMAQMQMQAQQGQAPQQPGMEQGMA